MTSSIVVTPKGTSLHGNTSFEPQSVKIGLTVRPGRVIVKKDRAGQSKKSQRRYILPTFGRSVHWTNFHRNLHSSCRPKNNHVCKLLKWNFQGLRFYRGSNFSFSYWFLHGPHNIYLRVTWF